MGRRRNFQDKVVVITGAAGGIGSALARRFGLAGARLALLDLNGDAGSKLAGELTGGGGAPLWMGCDVTDEAACRGAMEEVSRHFGGVDVLINNAGITHRSAFSETDVAVFRRVMEVNFFGALNCTKAALPTLLQRQGLIVTISSIAGIAPLYGRTGYSASKHALHGLFGSLRSEVAPSGVDVLIVCPGFTATGLSTNALDGDGTVTRHPQSRVGALANPESVANAVFEAASVGRSLLVLTATGRVTYLLNRIAPRLYEKIMARALRNELER